MGTLYWATSDITTDSITNLYLYGTSTTPVDLNDRVRTAAELADRIEIHLTQDDFMANGPGNQVRASNIPIIADLFMNSNAYGLSGTYSAGELKASIGIAAFQTSFYNYGLNTSSSDYASRIYIYNAEGFVLSDETILHFDGSNSYVENLGIRAYDDNFDFSSSSTVATLGNTYLRSQIDPQFLGSQVVVKVTGMTHVLDSHYDLTEFNNDAAAWSASYSPSSSLTGLPGAMQGVIDSLHADGVIQYERDGRPIIYGTGADDTIQVGSPAGTILVGGSGNDVLYGAEGNDQLLGGKGNDTLAGNEGSDFLDGGVGFDIVSYTDHSGNFTLTSALQSATPASFTPDGNPIFFLNSDRYGALESDVVRGVESIHFGSGNDKILITGNLDLASGTLALDGGSGANAISFEFGDKAVSSTIDGITHFQTIVGSTFGDDIAASGDISTIFGGSGDDSLSGSTSFTYLFGGAGYDVLTAGSGGALLDGGSSPYTGGPTDTYNGGAAADTFVISPSAGSFTYVVINNVDELDRIVIRSSLATGVDAESTTFDTSSWQEGVVLKGGCSTA